VKTDALIDLLATGAGPVPRYATSRRLLAAATIGTAGALLLLWIVFGINPALQADAARVPFWLKFAFAMALAGAGVLLCNRLARPGVPVGAAIWAALLPLLAMWLLGAMALIEADPAARAQLLYGASWRVCPFNITLLSLPAFAASVWAMRGLAPTDTRRAGAVAGFGAGSLGAVVYCLHCTEYAAPFIGIWYVIGILIPSVAGFVLGPRLLRW
jgi:hypothetical protein